MSSVELRRLGTEKTLLPQFQLVFIQTFIALTTEVMADILIKLLAQQPVFVLQPHDPAS
jgi:hypothetical protein